MLFLAEMAQTVTYLAMTDSTFPLTEKAKIYKIYLMKYIYEKELFLCFAEIAVTS